MNKNIIILVIVLIIVALGVYFLMQPKNIEDQNQNQQTPLSNEIQKMKIETLKEGAGEGAKTGDTVTVNYTGTLLDGTKFDSSINPGREPFPFTLGQNRVIQGWEQGVLGMKVGEKRKLTIPPELAYGPQSPSPLIPPNSTLVFEIDLLSIN